MKPPRIYVITSCPPGCYSVEAIMLRDILASYPEEYLRVAIVGPSAGTEASLGCLPWMDKVVFPLRTRRYYGRAGWPLARATRFLAYRTMLGPDSSRLSRKLAADARAFAPDRIVAVMDHRRLFTVLPDFFTGLQVPASAMVLDPPEWLIAQVSPDRFSVRQMLHGFNESLRLSESAAFISDPMRDAYSVSHRSRGLVLRHGFESTLWQAARQWPSGEDHLTIGLAGKLYCLDAWSAFVAALDSCGWRIGNRDVRVRVIGGALPGPVAGRSTYELYGWRDQPETIRLLAGCDIAYVPYWFDGRHAEVSMYSFPGKLSAYAAAATPVLFHGPAVSAAARYVDEHGIGRVCSSTDPGDILSVISDMLDPEVFACASAAMARVRETDLGAAVMRSRFGELIHAEGVDFKRRHEPLCTCSLARNADRTQQMPNCPPVATRLAE